MEAIDLYNQRRRMEVDADAKLATNSLRDMLEGIDVRQYMEQREALMDRVKALPRKA